MRLFASKLHIFTLITLFYLQLVGCMLGPDFKSPKPPQTKRYTATPLPAKTASLRSAGQAGQAQSFAMGQDLPADWWTLFHSKELNQLIQQGLENSPNLAAAQAALVQAREAVNVQVGSTLYPALSAQMSATRQKFSDETFGINNGNNPIFNLFNPSLSISYTLDTFGAARRQIEALRAQVDYQTYLLQASYLTLTSNIATTAITAASFRAQIEATRQLIDLQAKTLGIIQRQFRLGGAAGADVLTQKTALAQTRASLPPLEQNLAKSLHVLAVLIGTLPSEARLPLLRLEQLHLPKRLPLRLPSVLAKQRPDIQASEALLHAASAQIGVATANLYPQLTLSGNYGWESDVASSLFKPHTLAWAFGGQILQPVFNGGALMAKKRQAIAAYEQAEAQYRQTVLQAFQNVADTLRAIENDAEAFRAQREAELAAQNSLRLTQQQYHLGGVSYLSLLTAQRQYQSTQIGRIQAQASRYNDTVALFQALGGGWWPKKMEAYKQ